MNAVIMGRKTWESMQQKRLKNRINVVISGSQTLTEEYAKSHDIILAKSLQDALDKLSHEEHVGDVVIGDVFVIGGASVYQDALCHPMCTTAHVTWIHGNYDCDTFFPVEALVGGFEKDGTVTCVEETPIYSIVKYGRRVHKLYNSQP
jgi:dihydrofolate reductase